MAARLVTVVLLAAMLQACTDAGSATGRPEMASRRVDTPAGKPSATSNQTGTRPPIAGPLSGSEIGQVYRFIVENYVDSVDHAALIEAANGALREASTSASALPVDTAPLDGAPLPAGSPERDWVGFSRAFDAVVQKHQRWASETRPDWTVLRKMLAVLEDSHAVFLDPEEVQRLSETTFSGVGVRMAKRDKALPPVVVEVFDNSPARKSGIKPGDHITAVDGKPTAEMAVNEVVRSVRGQQGSPVTLTVNRTGQAPKDYPLVRARVDPPRVEGGSYNQVGYLRIRGFADGVPEQVQQVLSQGTQRGARVWIMDLRGNSGGSVEAMARVASIFIGQQPVAMVEDRSGDKTPIGFEARGPALRVPLVVLVDKETASGAEILAAALREYRVAAIVGTQTAGNVGIARPQPLPDGSAVQVTIGRLTTPNGTPLDKVGIQPDELAEVTDANLEAEQDPVMSKAIEVLASRVQAR